MIQSHFSRSLLVFVSALVVSSGPLTAQNTPRTSTPELVDRIVAIVGDSVILNSELEEELRAMEAQGQRVPRTDSAALARMKRQMVEQRIERLILVQFAQRDTTIAINESQLTAQLDQIVNERRAAMGGPVNFDQALRQQRLTLAEYRDLLMADLRGQTLVNQYVQKMTRDRKPPPITEQQLKAEFDRMKAASLIPQRQASVEFRQVVLAPRASDEARKIARAKADSILTLIRAGEDFAALAKRFSEDGSAENGGDLGWARPETYVKEFGDAVLMLRPGEVGPVVETTYGFHIIKLEKVKGAERQARHILIRPATAEGDFERLMERGRQVAAQLKAGANVDSMIKAVGSPDERPQITATPEQLTQAGYQPVTEAKSGDVVGPFAIGPEGSRQVVVAKVDNARPAGEQEWTDPGFRPIFRQNIERQRLIAEIIGELRRQTYIDVRL